MKYEKSFLENYKSLVRSYLENIFDTSTKKQYHIVGDAYLTSNGGAEIQIIHKESGERFRMRLSFEVY